MLGTVKKYNHSADGQAPYRGCRRGTTRKVGEWMPPLLQSQVRKYRGWREETGNFEEAEVSFPDPSLSLHLT